MVKILVKNKTAYQTRNGGVLASGDVAGAVRYDIEQTLTSAQQAIARNNIGTSPVVSISQNTHTLHIGSTDTGIPVPEGYEYIGVAHKDDVAHTHYRKVFYLANEAGEYANYKDASNNPINVAEGEIAFLKFNGRAWSKENTGIFDAIKYSPIKVTGVEWNTGGGIKYTNGEVYSSSAIYTNYIDVSGHRYILITRRNTTNAVTSGLCFYDADKVFISGLRDYYGRDLPYYTEVIALPEGCKYIRTTFSSAIKDNFSLSLVGNDSLYAYVMEIEDSIYHDSKLNIEWNIGKFVGKPDLSQLQIECDSSTNDIKQLHSQWFSVTDFRTLRLSGLLSSFSMFISCFSKDLNFLGEIEPTSNGIYTLKETTAYFAFSLTSSEAIDVDSLSGLGVTVRCRSIEPIKKPNLAKNFENKVRREFFLMKKVAGGNKNVEGTDITQAIKYSDDYVLGGGVIHLPETYTHDGKKTRLIWFCNGSGNPAPMDEYVLYKPFIAYLVAEGYAVADCWAWPALTYNRHLRPTYNFWCTPTNSAITYGFYDHLMKNYNLEPEIFVYSKSQGGLKAMFFEYSTIPVKAVCMLASRTTPMEGLYGYTDGERANSLIDLGFENIELDTQNHLTGAAAVLSTEYSGGWDDARKQYIADNMQLLIGTDPLFKGLINLRYEHWYYRVSRSLLDGWIAAEPFAKLRTPMMVCGANDDSVYWENLYIYYAGNNQLGYIRRVDMPSGADDPHHAVDTLAPKIDIVTKFGETIEDVPISYAEMLDFFRRYE